MNPMSILEPEFVPFLLKAKRNTYAAGDGGKVASSRPASHDLAFCEGDWSYLDTYLGGYAFIGEEAVWKGRGAQAIPVWGMNYAGTMTAAGIPDGFSAFLKQALLAVPAAAPYRGPEHFAREAFAYTCRWEGTLEGFHGEEAITLDGALIYRLFFHGGQIL